MGVSDDVGDLITFTIWSDTTKKVLQRSAVRTADPTQDAIPNLRVNFEEDELEEKTELVEPSDILENEDIIRPKNILENETLLVPPETSWMQYLHQENKAGRSEVV